MASAPGADLLQYAPVATGAFVAFVVVGALSLVIVQLYAGMGGGEGSGGTGARPSGGAAATADARRPAGRPIRASELSVANGDDGAPIYLALKDPYAPRTVVFDMSKGADFYGPGGPYHLFAGRDATCGLAKSSLDASALDGDVADLTAQEQETHIQWFTKFAGKYDEVGWLVKDGEPDYPADSESVAASETDKKNA